MLHKFRFLLSESIVLMNTSECLFELENGLWTCAKSGWSYPSLLENPPRGLCLICYKEREKLFPNLISPDSENINPAIRLGTNTTKKPLTPEAVEGKIRAVRAQHRDGKISLIAFYEESEKLEKQLQEAKEAAAEAKRRQTEARHGPGAHLHRLIERWTGEGITACCKCNSRIAEMNRRGPQWCRDNVERIVDWMIEEVDRRLSENDKPTPWRLRLGGLNLPGRRLALRRLVLTAVRRAERELRKKKRAVIAQ